jgi:energy-coupling factor transport system ATP-binding protein
MITLQQLKFKYPNTAFGLTIDQLTLDAGLTAIVGQNGAGKTTLIKLLTGLLMPQTGQIQLAGHSLTELTPAQRLRQIGITFQDPDDQLFNSTVESEVAWGLKQLGTDTETITATVDRVLLEVGLQDRREQNPYDLSLSERKLLVIATVLAIDPAIYLFDEPMVALDWQSRQRVMAIFHRLAEAGRQVIVITHDMDLVAAGFDSVTVLRAGEVVFTGTPTALFQDAALVQRAQLMLPRLMQITAALGDSGVYLDVADYARQHEA